MTAVSGRVTASAGGPQLDELLPPDAVRRLELAAGRRTDGFLHGDHLGLTPGSGRESGEARLYRPGEDDVRAMDWAVTARTNAPHVRDSVADRELSSWFLLDATPSMAFGTTSLEKRHLAVAAVAGLGTLAGGPADRVGGYLVTAGEVRWWPARTGRLALHAMLRSVLARRPTPERTPRAARRDPAGGGATVTAGDPTRNVTSPGQRPRAVRPCRPAPTRRGTDWPRGSLLSTPVSAVGACAWSSATSTPSPAGR